MQVINNLGSSYTVDATLLSGVETLEVVGGTGAVSVTNAGKVLNATLTSVNNNVTNNAPSTVVAGTSDSATVKISGVATTTSVTYTQDGVETINLVSTGGASGSSTNSTALTISDSRLQTLNFSGDKSAIVSASFYSADATRVGTFDGSNHRLPIERKAEA